MNYCIRKPLLCITGDGRAWNNNRPSMPESAWAFCKDGWDFGCSSQGDSSSTNKTWASLCQSNVLFAQSPALISGVDVSGVNHSTTQSEQDQKWKARQNHSSQFRTIRLISDHVQPANRLLQNCRGSVSATRVHTGLTPMFLYRRCILGTQDDEFPARDAEAIKAARIHGEAKSRLQPSSLQPCQSLHTPRESRSQASHLPYLWNIISARKWDGFGEMSECVCKPAYFTVNNVLCCSLSSAFIVSFSQHGSAAHPWDAKSHVGGNRRKCDGGDAPKTHEKMVKIWSV